MTDNRSVKASRIRCDAQFWPCVCVGSVLALVALPAFFAFTFILLGGGGLLAGTPAFTIGLLSALIAATACMWGLWTSLLRGKPISRSIGYVILACSIVTLFSRVVAISSAFPFP